MMKLPESFKIYFWDVDWFELQQNPEAYREFVICRLADKGDEGCFAWIRRHFGLLEVANIVEHARGVSPKTRTFWRNYARHLRGGNPAGG